MRRFIKHQAWFTPVSQRLFGSEVYSDSYYIDIERLEKTSVGEIAAWIGEHISPKTVIDVGCGPGHMMAALEARGIRTFGVDIASAALARAKDKGVSVQHFDLTVEGPSLPGTSYDLAISCEVAEHLDARFAEKFVKHMCAASDVIYLTAAEPNPSMGPGLHHVNEQPNEYWIARFEQSGFVLDECLTASARTALDTDQVIDYLRRPMIFRKTN